MTQNRSRQIILGFNLFKDISEIFRNFITRKYLELNYNFHRNLNFQRKKYQNHEGKVDIVRRNVDKICL